MIIAILTYSVGQYLVVILVYYHTQWTMPSSTASLEYYFALLWSRNSWWDCMPYKQPSGETVMNNIVGWRPAVKEA